MAIVAAARRLFGEVGFTVPSTAEIAKAAGVSHGTLFLHFPRREDLQREVISRLGERIARGVHGAAARGSGMKTVLRSHLQAIAEDEELYARLLGDAHVLGPAARATLIGIQSAVAHHFFEGLSDTLTPEGGSAVSESPHSAAPAGRQALLFNTWLGLVHHYLVNRDLFAPRSSVIERWGEVLITHYTSLIEAQGGMK